MRRFSSYGPIDTEAHYYTPRKKLIERAYTQLMGENTKKDGHYITVWAPRQCGKTWVMQQVLFRLQKDSRFDVLKINLEHLKYETDARVYPEFPTGNGKVGLVIYYKKQVYAIEVKSFRDPQAGVTVKPVIIRTGKV
jgi:hypothetical protein